MRTTTRTRGPTCLLVLAALAGCAPAQGEVLEDGDWPGDPADPGDPTQWPALSADPTDPATDSIDPFDGLDTVDPLAPPPELLEVPGDVLAEPTGAAPPIVPVLDPPPGATCVAAAPVTRPASCPFGRNEVVVWAAGDALMLAQQGAQNLSDCTDYFISVPPFVATTTIPGVVDASGRLRQLPYKLEPRTGTADRMHGFSPRVHAMAEFHWASWAVYRRKTGATWRQIGHLFRQKMETAGYCVAGGDTWAINEAPTSIRINPAQRIGFENLVRGLTEGAPGMRAVRGAVFVWGMGHDTENLRVYKPSVERWLEDGHFWAQMNVAVRFWGQEVYVNPLRVCVGGVSLDQHARHMDEFSMHVANSAAVSGRHAANARSYLGRAYVPLLNAVWGALPRNGYGTTDIPLAQMQQFLTEEVYATRQFADTRAYADGRIGFGFGSYAMPTQSDVFGRTLAQSIEGAYGPGGRAVDACGDGSLCRCNVSGAAYHAAWSTFGVW